MTGPKRAELPNTLDPLGRAILRTQQQEVDPIGAAKQLLEAQNGLVASYGIIRVLVERLGGGRTPVEVSRAEWALPDPEVELRMDSDKKGNVTMSLRRKEEPDGG